MLKYAWIKIAASQINLSMVHFWRSQQLENLGRKSTGSSWLSADIFPYKRWITNWHHLHCPFSFCSLPVF